MTLDTVEIKQAWWKEASVYQIYPASFQDSNGDGVGDIKGIISRLDYIKSLGVDIVWLNPFFDSPQVDMGYDVADYKKIYSPYGTMEDVEQLISGLHSRGMKMLVDLVVNHTSDKHEWFQNSRSSIDNPFREWYIWRKPKIDSNGKKHPPNNWLSYFGGSAWEYDEKSGEYYLHLFAKEQPDLNWENESVRKAVHDIIRFWLDKGADGFRMDVINFISKDQRFPDAEIVHHDRDYQWGHKYYACGPRLHEYLKDIGAILKEYNAFSVGEMPACGDTNEIIKAVGDERGELNMIFHFELVDIDHGEDGKFYSTRKWPLSDLHHITDKWQRFMQTNNGWNAIYLENHDQPRSVSRYASDAPQFRTVAAKMIATFLSFQQGTLFIYQGQELGLRNVPKSWDISRYKDIESINHYNLVINKKSSPQEIAYVMDNIQNISRDNARVPFQWDNSPNAGFTSGTPWIEVNDDYKTVNASNEEKDDGSVLNYWRNILELRKTLKEVFVYGVFEMISKASEENILAFKRVTAGKEALVICNFSSKEIEWTIPTEFVGSKVLLSNYSGSKFLNDKLFTLGPFQSIVSLSDEQ